MDKDLQTLNYLKKNSTLHYGKPVSTATDCDDLSGIIKKKFNENISSQTLRRFFGLIKSESGQSHFTLDLLSKFCGYESYENFSDSYDNTQLELFFSDNENTDKDYWLKSEQLCIQITESTEFLVSTHHRLMEFPMARKYFMEHHPSRDLLGTVYSQYFLSYLKYSSSNDAKIFAYGFLFQGAFLTQNRELMDLYYNKILETPLSENSHVIVAGLKYGNQLLYTDFTGDDLSFRNYFVKMKKVRTKYIEASQKSVCSFESTVLESLIFTNRTNEIKFLIDNNTCQNDDDLAFIPAERKETHAVVWNILSAAAYQKMGNDKKTLEFINKINIDHLGIGWQKYYSIIYYFVKFNLADLSEKDRIIGKLKKLTEETYFSYYENLLDEIAEVDVK